MFSTEYKNTDRPKIVVFAGPNGSGKSTITKKAPITGLYVNADDIKRDSGCSDLAAAQEAELIRDHLLSVKKDFTFETVLSTERNLNLLEKAKSAGYLICAVYVLTKDSAINVARVQNRVESGGHDVPPDKIISRYNRSLGNVSKLIRVADMTRIVDNTGNEPDVICEVYGDRVKVWETKNWAKKEILSLLADIDKLM